MSWTMLDIGGGEAKPGMATIDINPLSEIVHNLNQFPWPVKDNAFHHIRLFHVLEHLQDPLRTLQEVYRVACPMAILDIRVPWWKRDMFANPAHVWWFKPAWFRRLHPDDNAWGGEMAGLCRMNWKVLTEKKVRGSRALWRVYEYHVSLEARK